MGIAQSGYEINTQELSLLYRVLDDEYKSVQLGRVARVSFRILESAGYFLPFVLFLAITLAVLSDAFDNGLIPIGRDAHAIFNDARLVFSGLIIPTLVVLVAILILNIRLFWKAYRQWRLSHRLTALELVDIGFRAPSRFPRIEKLKIAALLGPTGILLIFLYNIFQPGGGLADSGWRDSLVALMVLIILPVALLLTDNLFRRLQVRLDYFKEVLALRMELEKYGTAESILPNELATRLAGIERSRILRASAAASRTKFTDLFVRPAYAVKKSDKAADTLAQLDGIERLVLETAIEHLASLRSKAQTDMDSPCTSDVPGTSWRVFYEVERESRVIHVIAILRQGENQS